MKIQKLIVMFLAVATTSGMFADRCYNDGLRVRCVDDYAASLPARQATDFTSNGITNNAEIFSAGAMRGPEVRKKTEEEEKLEQENERKKEQNKS